MIKGSWQTLVVLLQFFSMEIKSAPNPNSIFQGERENPQSAYPSNKGENYADPHDRHGYRNGYTAHKTASQPLSHESTRYHHNPAQFERQSQTYQHGKSKSAPAYMLDLYHKFETDRYSHPMGNIVRSLSNIYVNPGQQTYFPSNRTRRHIIMFNISSIPRDEDIHLAELRLYALVESDRQMYYGTNRLVAVYDVDNSVRKDRSPYYIPLASKNILGANSGWETFSITPFLQRWVRDGVTMKTFQVRIETLHLYYHLPADVDVGTDQDEHGPLLVIFSDDKKRRISQERELHELFMHTENIHVSTVNDVDGNDDYDDYEYETSKGRYKRDLVRSSHHPQSSDGPAEREEPTPELLKRKSLNSMPFLYQRVEPKRGNTDSVRDQSSEVSLSNAHTSHQRQKRRVRSKDRSPCKRKSLYVNFEDINWHTWIIAPKGYEAYQCSGKCNFPLSDHLTPTKHAIIQTLLNTNFPKESDTACCVPTALDPISILYVDEEGVVTYKYKYEGMVVKECGCR